MFHFNSWIFATSSPEKRQVAQKAEADFFALLKETKGITETSNWKEVRRTEFCPLDASSCAIISVGQKDNLQGSTL